MCAGWMLAWLAGSAVLGAETSGTPAVAEVASVTTNAVVRGEGFDPLAALHRRELRVIHAIQRVEGLSGPMKAISHLGPSKYQWALMVLIFLAVRRRLAIRLALSSLVGLWLREILALALHSPRPYFIDEAVLTFTGQIEPRYGYSLPSGHAFMGTAVWFLIAAEVRRPWAWTVAGLVSVAIAVSRLYLGVHFPSDVVLGMLLGLGWAWLTLRAESWLAPRLATRSRAELAGWAVLTGAGMALLAAGLQAAYGAMPVPDHWILAYGVRDRLLESGYKAGGGLVGIALGLTAFRHRARVPVPLWRCLVGFGAIAVAAKFGLQPLGDWFEARYPGQRFLIAAGQFMVLWGCLPEILIRLGFALGSRPAPAGDGLVPREGPRPAAGGSAGW